MAINLLAIYVTRFKERDANVPGLLASYLAIWLVTLLSLYLSGLLLLLKDAAKQLTLYKGKFGFLLRMYLVTANRQGKKFDGTPIPKVT